MLKYLYIDESGDPGLKGSKYLIISCIITDNPAKLSRIVKNMRRYRFRKQLRKACEIKACKSKPEIIEHMLKEMNKLSDTSFHAIILEKERITSDYLINNKHKLYNYIAGRLAEKMKIRSNDLEIRIDKSKGKQVLREDFNKYFTMKLRDNCSLRKVEIYHSYSHAWCGLQFADIFAWACYQKFEHKKSEFLDLIPPEKRELIHF